MGKNEIEKIARGFNRLMLLGKVRQAVRLVYKKANKNLLSTNDLAPVGADENGNTTYQTTQELLMQKHPEGKIPPSDVLSKK